MKNNRISTYFLFFSIFTFIAIFFFIVQKSYENLMKPINLAKTSDSSQPLDPNLDVSVLDQISQRQFYSPPSATPPMAEFIPTP
jgi:hypothetical protein